MSPQRKYRPLKKRHVDGVPMLDANMAKKAAEVSVDTQEKAILPGASKTASTVASRKGGEVQGFGKKPSPSSDLTYSNSVDHETNYDDEAALSSAKKPPAKEGEKHFLPTANPTDSFVDPPPLVTAPLQRAASFQYSNDLLMPMPPLLRNTTSSALWSAFLGPNIDSVVGPPMLEQTTSLGQPLLSEPLIHTPMDNIIPSHHGMASSQPRHPPGSRASGPEPPPSGIDDVFVQCAELAFRANQLPTPNMEPTSTESEAAVASALLDLTPSLSDKERTPLTEIGPQQVATSEKVRAAGPLSPIDSVTHTAASLYSIAANRSQHLLENVPITTKACKCKNTRCLKLYCACFQGGSFCDPRLCKCKACENNAEHNGPKGTRSRAVKMIMKRRLDAFEPRPKKTREGCSCQKSR